MYKNDDQICPFPTIQKNKYNPKGTKNAYVNVKLEVQVTFKDLSV